MRSYQETTEDELTEFARWREGMKGKLITVKQIGWGADHSRKEPVILSQAEKDDVDKAGGTLTVDGVRYEVDGEGQGWRWTEYQAPLEPAIVTTQDELRGFLKSIGLRVTLYWTVHAGKKRVWYPLDKGRIEAVIDGNSLGVRNSTHNRVRNRGKD